MTPEDFRGKASWNEIFCTDSQPNFQCNIHPANSRAELPSLNSAQETSPFPSSVKQGSNSPFGELFCNREPKSAITTSPGQNCIDDEVGFVWTPDNSLFPFSHLAHKGCSSHLPLGAQHYLLVYSQDKLWRVIHKFMLLHIVSQGIFIWRAVSTSDWRVQSSLIQSSSIPVKGRRCILRKEASSLLEPDQMCSSSSLIQLFAFLLGINLYVNKRTTF